MAELRSFNLPPNDLQMLSAGIRNGGAVLIVRVSGESAALAERIFESHHAVQVDEQVAAETPNNSSSSGTVTNSPESIPVVEEHLVVGKRAVAQGGVTLAKAEQQL